MNAPVSPTTVRGFTLIELMVALALFAMLSGILFGSLRLAGRSADAGEEKAQASSGMRLASENDLNGHVRAINNTQQSFHIC